MKKYRAKKRIISVSHLIHSLEGIYRSAWFYVLWDHNGNGVFYEMRGMIIAVLHVDIQLHQVAAGKCLGEVRHLDVQCVPWPLLIVQLAYQVYITP